MIHSIGGSIVYEDQVDQVRFDDGPAEQPEPNWLEQLLGEDFFHSVVKVELIDVPVTDSEFAYLKNLDVLEQLFVEGTNITDDGLACLHRLDELEIVFLLGTQVSDNGIEHLTLLGRPPDGWSDHRDGQRGSASPNPKSRVCWQSPSNEGNWHSSDWLPLGADARKWTR